MNIDDLTIGQAKGLAAVFSASNSNMSPVVGKVCVVRTYSAGVHFGEVVSQNGREVFLKNARRIWRWKGAFSLSEIGMSGIDKSGSRVSVSVPEIVLTEAIEIIPMSQDAIARVGECHE